MLRWPRENTGESGSGLSPGTDPSGASRRILPASDSGSWAASGTAASPVATYNMRSGPKMSRPPLWTPALGIPVRIDSAAPSSEPSHFILTTRLSVAVVR